MGKSLFQPNHSTQRQARNHIAEGVGSVKKYIQEAPFEEAMNRLYVTKDVEPFRHTIYTGDFMGMCTHDIACQVCFDSPAVIERNVTIGQYRQMVQPCWNCQKEGYKIRLSIKQYLKRLLRL